MLQDIIKRYLLFDSLFINKNIKKKLVNTKQALLGSLLKPDNLGAKGPKDRMSNLRYLPKIFKFPEIHLTSSNIENAIYINNPKTAPDKIILFLSVNSVSRFKINNIEMNSKLRRKNLFKDRVKSLLKITDGIIVTTRKP